MTQRQRLGFVLACAASVAWMAGLPPRVFLLEVSMWFLAASTIRLVTARKEFAYGLATVLAVMVYAISLRKQDYLGTKLWFSDVAFITGSPTFVLDFMPVWWWLAAVVLVVALVGLWMLSTRQRWQLAQLILVPAAVWMCFSKLTDADYIWQYDSKRTKNNLTMFVGSAFHQRALVMPPADGASAICCATSKPEDLKLHKAAGMKPPNLVVVLLESTFNVDLVSQLQPKIDHWAAFKANPIKVYTRGGGTWVQEYGVLHGVSPPSYGPNFFNIHLLGPGKLPGRLAPMLADEEYDTDSFLSYEKSFYSSQMFHHALGIQNITDCADTQSCDKTSTERDHQVFEAITQRIRATEKPQFIFGLTITNHSPHKPELSNLATSCSAGMEAQRCGVLKEYIRRETLVQAQIMAWTTQLSALSEDTVVVFFGDHIPGDVARLLVKTDFVDGRDDETVAFGFDTRSHGFFALGPEVFPQECKNTAHIEVSDLDAVLLHRAGYSSKYVEQKIQKLRQQCS
jgi:hypothetical protein